MKTLVGPCWLHFWTFHAARIDVSTKCISESFTPYGTRELICLRDRAFFFANGRASWVGLSVFSIGAVCHLAIRFAIIGPSCIVLSFFCSGAFFLAPGTSPSSDALADIRLDSCRAKDNNVLCSEEFAYGHLSMLYLKKNASCLTYFSCVRSRTCADYALNVVFDFWVSNLEPRGDN